MSYVTIPTPTFFRGGESVQFSLSLGLLLKGWLSCARKTCSKDLFWFVSFQDSKWWVYSVIDDS